MSPNLKHPKVCGYVLDQEIGGGGFSTVYRAVNLPEHRVAACKVIYFTPSTTPSDRKTYDKEMRVHAALKHVNVLEFLNAVVVEAKHGKVYYPGVYMLLELAAGGDLFDKIAPDKGVSDDLAHYYFTQLLSGITYIHTQGVCHRDLKPENLLLDIRGVLKISDFGLSAVYKLKETGKTRTLSERCGSLPYVAPELAREGVYEAEPVDVWGCGVILFTMLVGNTPWDEPTMHSSEFVSYVNGTIFTHHPWCRLSSTALDLLRGMMTPNPKHRLTLSEVQGHEWCLRPSQLNRASPLELADRLTQELRESGDLDLAVPDWSAKARREDEGDDEEMDTDDANEPSPSQTDADTDTPMLTATHASQFTQSLMLFSQTQSGGSRYVPSLTRFYASLRPRAFVPILLSSFSSLGVTAKVAQLPPEGIDDPSSALYVENNYTELTEYERSQKEKARLRIGGFDNRKQVYKGWVEVEYFRRGEWEGSFVVFKRDVGNPISWRMVWKGVVRS
ncbi:hypothetical protein NMY22_g14148 [Coprinellus aureogranulatus]|nr:hypothetical protein NMY22_g14148 [Coprinellus aureogranulatus]